MSKLPWVILASSLASGLVTYFLIADGVSTWLAILPSIPIGILAGLLQP